MLVIPAIDLKDGECVRLRQGLMEQSTVFSDDPVAMAGHWRDQGARRLHLVDLNGAFAGTPMNRQVVADICKAYPELPVQIGGGIRDTKVAAEYIDLGVSYIIIGTLAVKNPTLVKTLCREFPGKVIVGIDAKDGWVATEGWADVSDLQAVDLAQRFEDVGVSAIVYTDIARDGMLQGVNALGTAEMAKAVSIPIIASGGIKDTSDIKALCQADAPIYAAITGRAIYEGSLDFASAQTLADKLSGAER